VVKFLLRRCAATVVLVFLVSLLTFVLLEMAPDPARARAGVTATEQEVEAVRVEFGLDRGPVERYVSWLGDAVTGDFGTSLQYKTPVSDIISSRLGITLTIAVAALLLSLLLGIALGTLAALKADSWIDRTILTASALAWSAPAFWVAMVLVAVFAINLGWFPATGWTAFGDDPAGWFRGLVLPAVALSLGGTSNLARITRSSVIGVLQSDHLRSVRVKGLSPWSILRSHVLPNALSPVITSSTLLFIGLFNAAAVAEIVFAIPGLGTQAFSAASFGDTTTVLGIVVVAALVIGAANLAADLLQAMVNPRVRLA
jgi:peptide/nickel transport system permease protein